MAVVVVLIEIVVVVLISAHYPVQKEALTPSKPTRGVAEVAPACPRGQVRLGAAEHAQCPTSDQVLKDAQRLNNTRLLHLGHALVRH
mmetsp:Transcript_20929/g.39788  ORF Transcript_20929/g.39788 Transcript_20929/m.39788 type:complete len:87 (-) Transcript_20929:106-366(-)